jgi:hypothetical protein
MVGESPCGEGADVRVFVACPPGDVLIPGWVAGFGCAAGGGADVGVRVCVFVRVCGVVPGITARLEIVGDGFGITCEEESAMVCPQ